MASKGQLETMLRTEILEVIINALAEHFDLDATTQIEYVNTGEITLPLVDAEGNEKYPKVKVSIPRGTRDGNGGYIPYDGHEAAEMYRDDKANKAQERAVKKAMRAADKGKKTNKDGD